jgi:sporadic carbohydrate cluster protein (TIGR04323 family)
MNTQNLNKKILRGYISSRDINGAYYPQNIQNLIIRNFAELNNIKFQLSGTEWNIKNSFLMLRSILSEKNDGVIFFSIFQIYENKIFFKKILKEIIEKNKLAVFALENIAVSSSKELNKLLKTFKIMNITNSKDYLKNIKKTIFKQSK